MHASRISLLTVSTLFCLNALPAQQPGYTDTPVLTTGWRVHDAERPRPPVVTPPPAGAPVAAPSDATILFDGKDLSAWRGRKDKGEWKVENGYMEVNGKGDIRTAAEFGDCQLHLEWMAPAEVRGNSQGRGNSGVFFFGRYEVQILDSYDNPSYADGQAGAIYGQFPPLVNASRKPGEWQTYDILFIAPRFDDKGALQSPARLTVLQNGIAVHINQELMGPTSHKSLPRYRAHGAKGHIKLQDHGNPIRFRNIWVRELDNKRPEPTPRD